MVKNGIDLSKHNVVDNWCSVAQKVDFVILRAGGCFGKYYKDPKFEQYYNACKMHGIPVGAYYDCGKEFYTHETGLAYAEHFKNLLSGKQFEYPVFMDIEVTPRNYRKMITDATVAFCTKIEEYKYYVGIYASDVFGFADLLEINRIGQFDKWVARYGRKPTYVKSYGIWQNSSTARLTGIQGNVDLDTAYKDYPSIIKGAHLNGY